VRQSQLAIKIQEGNKTAELAKHVVENLEKYLSATQLAITGIGLALGWMGQDIFGGILISLFSLF
jgi:CBS domain containing-hemolysin-like protein